VNGPDTHPSSTSVSTLDCTIVASSSDLKRLGGIYVVESVGRFKPIGNPSWMRVMSDG
jgi:hypothetical protein